MTDEAHAQAAEVAVARETRLARLEEDVKKLKPKGKDFWEKAQAIAPLVAPIVAGLLIAFVTYLLTGSVNNAIQRQQLQLSNVKEMRDLLNMILRRKQTVELESVQPVG